VSCDVPHKFSPRLNLRTFINTREKRLQRISERNDESRTWSGKDADVIYFLDRSFDIPRGMRPRANWAAIDSHRWQSQSALSHRVSRFGIRDSRMTPRALGYPRRGLLPLRFHGRALQFQTEVADARFLPIPSLVSPFAILSRKQAPRREEKQDSSRECNYVCAMRYALVLEMHWRLGANHSPRRRGVSGAVWRNILPPAGRRSCRPTDPVVGPIPAAPLLLFFFPSLRALSHR